MVINLKETPKYMEAMNTLAEKMANGATVDEQKELFANAFEMHDLGFHQHARSFQLLFAE